MFVNKNVCVYLFSLYLGKDPVEMDGLKQVEWILAYLNYESGILGLQTTLLTNTKSYKV